MASDVPDAAMAALRGGTLAHPCRLMFPSGADLLSTSSVQTIDANSVLWD